MPPQPSGRLLGRSVLIAAIATLPLVAAAPAGAAIPPAPGNLIANWGFDTDTAGWGSFGGSLARTPNGSSCSTTNPGAATATRQTGDVYTISDSQGAGNLPTVRSTAAGETFIAYARVSAASASAAGSPAGSSCARWGARFRAAEQCRARLEHDDKQMSIQGIAVPLGEAGDCF